MDHWQYICLSMPSKLEPKLSMEIGMKLLGEDHKIGYTALIIGVISLLNAWLNILSAEMDGLEILSLIIGLVASLWGISLILKRQGSASATGEIAAVKPEMNKKPAEQPGKAVE